MVQPISGLINKTILDFHALDFEPQKLRELYLAHAMPMNNAFNYMEMVGRRFPVKDVTFKAMEEGWRWSYITTTATVSGQSSGSDFTVTLGAADIENGRSFPRAGDDIKLPDSEGGYKARINYKTIVSPTSHTLNCTPYNTADDWNYTSGTVLIVTDNSFADGMGQPDGVSSWAIEREFSTQIIKEALKITGRSIGKPLWCDKWAADGKSIKGIYAKETFDTQMRMEMRKVLLFWLGQSNNNLTVGATESTANGGRGLGEVITTSKGAIQWATENGYAMNVAIGSEAEADLQEIKDYNLSQGIATDKMLFFMGSKRIAKYNALIRTMNGGGTTGYGGGASYIDGMLENATLHQKGLRAAFDFAEVVLGNMTYTFAEAGEFNNPMIMNAPGHKGDEYGIGFPLSIIKNTNPRSIAVGAMMPNIGFTYYDNNGYNRSDETWLTGGAGGDFPYTTTYDEKELSLRTDIGTFFMNTNQYIHW